MSSPSSTSACVTSGTTPSYLWLGQSVPDEQRFLSCSLNINWPDVARLDPGAAVADESAVVAALGEIFDATIIGTRAINSRSRVEDGRFAGWLSYSSFDRSWKALQGLHQALRSAGPGAAAVVPRPVHPPRLAVRPERAVGERWPPADRRSEAPAAVTR